MRLLTDDAVRLTAGRPPLGDTEPELAGLPARMTVTLGFGPGFFARAGPAGLRPPSVQPLPAFGIDELEAGLSDTGLIFASFQQDIDAQYLPIQRRLDHADLLNRWTTPVGLQCSPCRRAARPASSSGCHCPSDPAPAESVDDGVRAVVCGARPGTEPATVRSRVANLSIVATQAVSWSAS